MLNKNIGRLPFSLKDSLCKCSYTNKTLGLPRNKSLLNDLFRLSLGETVSGKSELLVEYK